MTIKANKDNDKKYFQEETDETEVVEEKRDVDELNISDCEYFTE